MDDDKSLDIISTLDKHARNRTGESFDPESFKVNFHLFTPQKRADMLDEFDAALKKVDVSNMRQYAKTTRLRADLDTINLRCLKNGR
jgi:hypothetical protein